MLFIMSMTIFTIVRLTGDPGVRNRDRRARQVCEHGAVRRAERPVDVINGHLRDGYGIGAVVEYRQLDAGGSELRPID